MQKITKDTGIQLKLEKHEKKFLINTILILTIIIDYCNHVLTEEEKEKFAYGLNSASVAKYHLKEFLDYMNNSIDN